MPFPVSLPVSLLAALAATAGALPTLESRAEPAAVAAAPKLNTLAKAAGLKYFGTATDNPELTNTSYTSILYDNGIFGQQTPGNSQKWGPTEPSNGTFTYTQGDAIVNAAIAHGQILRCHNLVWYQQLPNFLNGGQTFTAAQLTQILQAHIQSEVTHFKGKCYAWDVVNEALNDDGTMRSDIFLNTLGPNYINMAFQFARQADPTVKLYYNDYNIETAGAKSTAAQNIVRNLKAQGLIDGVGLQAHFIEGASPSAASLVSNLQAFTALGVEVAYTELDVRIQLPDSTAKQAQQATDYANVVQACTEVDGCVGVTVWDFFDPFSWVPGTFAGQGDADLVTSSFTPKPAWNAIANVLTSAAARRKRA